MSLLFLDGFDHYASADMGKKWNHRDSFMNVTTSVKRTGAQSADFSSSNNQLDFLLPSAQQHATIIIGFALYANSWLANAFANMMVFSGDGSTTVHDELTVNGFGAFRVTRGVGGTVLGTSDPIIKLNTWHYVEVKLTLSTTVGVVNVRVDGDDVINLTGQNTKNGGTGAVFDTIRMNTGGYLNDCYFDDVYICNGAGSVNNDFLGDIAVETLYPSGAGNTTGMTPSTGANYAAVDDPTANTSDYVSSSVASTKDTYAFGDTNTPRNICGLQVVQYAQKSDGSRLVVPVVRRSGTDYDGTGQSNSRAWKFLRTIYETDPSTSASWTDANVNAAEFGVKVG